jgi:PleD family two-component response regulator
MNRSVLCLFDSELAVERLKSSLGPTCRVKAVSTVLGALQELKKMTPDLVIVQTGLRDESCFDFLKAAQPVTVSRHIPMVAVSIDDMYHESIEAFIARSCQFFGCNCYLRYSDFSSDALRFLLAAKISESGCSAAC